MEKIGYSVYDWRIMNGKGFDNEPQYTNTDYAEAIKAAEYHGGVVVKNVAVPHATKDNTYVIIKQTIVFKTKHFREAEANYLKNKMK